MPLPPTPPEKPAGKRKLAGKVLVKMASGVGRSRILGCPGRNMALLVVIGGTWETKNEEEVWFGCIPLLHQPGSDPRALA